MRYNEWTDKHLASPVIGALVAHKGNVTAAAKDLGAPLRSLYALIARLDIDLDKLRTHTRSESED